jgi:amidophosphoribosyltransferase
MSVGEIRNYLGADSLAYLELPRLLAATGASPTAFCSACCTGNYPVPIVEELAGEPNSQDGAPDLLGPGTATSPV